MKRPLNICQVLELVRLVSKIVLNARLLLVFEPFGHIGAHFPANSTTTSILWSCCWLDNVICLIDLILISLKIVYIILFVLQVLCFDVEVSLILLQNDKLSAFFKLLQVILVVRQVDHVRLTLPYMPYCFEFVYQPQNLCFLDAVR